MTTTAPPKTFHVHLFTVVRVKLCDVVASGHRRAVEAALNDPRLRDFYDRFESADSEYAEEISHYLVDVAGDDDFAESLWFYAAEEPVLGIVRDLVAWAEVSRSPEVLDRLIASARETLACTI